MDKLRIQKYIGASTLTLSQAMQKIDENAGGVLFLVDEDNKLVGCISDGDVRRFLLSGGKMDAPALAAANRAPKSAFSAEEAEKLFHSRNFALIPILRIDGTIADIYNGTGHVEKPRGALKIPVVINAGGKGTRLDPYTRVLPKPLIPVGELPIMEHIMREFLSYSCDDFHVIVNYKRELMKAYFSENDKDYRVSWYDEDKPLGTGGGLSLLRGKLDGTFFFTNCDNLLRANYERILEFHRNQKNVITMVCAYKNFSIPYGVVEIGESGKIVGMREKPLMSFLTNTGIYVVEPEVLDDIEAGVPIGFPDVVSLEMQKGRNVAVFPVSESEWMDMGQLSELEKMRKKLYGDA